MTTTEILEIAKKAKETIILLREEEKNNALKSMAKELLNNQNEILKENQKDVEDGKKTLSSSMIDRLTLTKERIKDMADSLVALCSLKDPVGKILEEKELYNGLKMKKVSVPMGVVGIIYESRPNVTSDAASLCFKSSNVAVLRGGKECYRSSKAIVLAMKKGLKNAGLDENYINLIDDTTRQSANEMMTAKGYIDLLIPRGGKGLISACVENATVPCIETGTGICHVYVEKTADFDMALEIIKNAKTSRPSVCNACEVLLVDREIAKEFLPQLKKALVDEFTPSVKLVLCEEAFEIIEGEKADDNSFDTEFLDYTLAVKIVEDYKEAVSHILKHSTNHSEAIVTKDEKAMEYFVNLTDSAAVYVNASTRFTDGGQFGLGCEMGISTQKLHARGPMGLKELTAYKYIVKGTGQVR